MDPSDVVLLCLAAFLAGGLDAIVGGGGLVQLPALLVVLPHQSVVSLLGTNKLSSVVGTSSAAVTYAQRVTVDRRTAGLLVGSAFVGALSGAAVATQVPGGGLKPVVLLALVGTLVFVVRRPALGEVEQLRLSVQTQHRVAVGGGLGIGFYDGLVGPGTGTFFVFLLVGAVGLSFLHASATAKAANTATNLAALGLFAALGHVLWALGFAMAASNLAGSQIGARLAIHRGSAWVRRVFVVVVTALIVRLAYDVLL